jgi:hypothetical protein
MHDSPEEAAVAFGIQQVNGAMFSEPVDESLL